MEERKMFCRRKEKGRRDGENDGRRREDGQGRKKQAKNRGRTP